MKFAKEVIRFTKLGYVGGMPSTVLLTRYLK